MVFIYMRLANMQASHHLEDNINTLDNLLFDIENLKREFEFLEKEIKEQEEFKKLNEDINLFIRKVVSCRIDGTSYLKTLSQDYNKIQKNYNELSNKLTPHVQIELPVNPISYEITIHNSTKHSFNFLGKAVKQVKKSVKDVKKSAKDAAKEVKESTKKLFGEKSGITGVDDESAILRKSSQEENKKEYKEEKRIHESEKKQSQNIYLANIKSKRKSDVIEAKFEVGKSRSGSADYAERVTFDNAGSGSDDQSSLRIGKP
jgi:hypothetical protein